MTTPTPDRPPLWRVMEVAEETCSADFTNSKARMILATRDWFHQHSDLSMKVATFHQVYDLLTAEAERAERGDG